MLIYSADGTKVIRTGHDAITPEDLKQAAEPMPDDCIERDITEIEVTL